MVNHRVKLKEREKKDKYLDLARELKKPRNMKVTMKPIVIVALGTFAKGLLKGLEDLEIRGRVKTIQTTTLLRSARILRRVLSFKLHRRSSAKAYVKNSQGVNNNKHNNDNNNPLQND